MKQTTITIEVPTGDLRNLTNEYLAMYWSVAQANPVPNGDKAAGELVGALTYEIVRRWLKANPPLLYGHQPRDHYWSILSANGKWVDGVWTHKSELPGEVTP
ncbi:hypothetical protein IGB42_02614 [Andreprevotia sp. IGB-42]|uniref:hypothetical protein n=1 Tax=Andreprevotia sp. IGB-42 TaxID=2497473 RepID=UPI0013572391|nr:hypothetical protein [Andreprevotia sp. IGB-42]KAF0812771.1 hypothetical protein IGB42_02614 [Andreprevotia sp. IGB-42]